MNAPTRIAFSALLLATLAGCGNKGPLVLPPPVNPPAGEATSPDADVGSPADTAPPADASDDTTPHAPIAPPADDTPTDEGDGPQDDGSEDDFDQDGGNG